MIGHDKWKSTCTDCQSLTKETVTNLLDEGGRGGGGGEVGGGEGRDDSKGERRGRQAGTGKEGNHLRQKLTFVQSTR